MTKIDVTDNYIRVRIRSPKLFVENSFRTVWISKNNGIKSIMGKLVEDKSKIKVQSYLFEASKWDEEKVNQWIKSNKKDSKAELLADKRVILTAGVTLTSEPSNLTISNHEVKKLTEEEWNKKESQASINDNYFFYCEPIHEGMNENGDYFFKDELINNYRSVSYKPIDWEHIRNQVIGFSLESQLIAVPDKPLAIGFNGVINRLSPYLYTESEDRDSIIRQRFFEDKLAMSMECVFDSVRCVECGYETDNILDFEYHCHEKHYSELALGKHIGRGLVGVDFVGFGIVEFPADLEAKIVSLRTSDDGTLAISVANLLEDLSFSKKMAFSTPNIDLVDDKLNVAAKNNEKNDDNKTKNSKNNDINNGDFIAKKSTGGNVMFKLMEKIADCKTLSDIFVVAQNVLSDFMGNNTKLDEKDAEAFITELNEVIKAHINSDNFKVDKVYTFTSQDKLDAVTKARNEEKVVVEELKNAHAKEVDKLSKEKINVQAELDSVKKEFETIVNASKEAELVKKVNAFLDDLKKSGITLADNMANSIKGLVSASINDDEKLKAIKDDLIITIKKSKLVEGSKVMGGGSASDEEEPKELGDKLAAARAKHLKDKEGNNG